MQIPKRYWNSKISKIADPKTKAYVEKYVRDIDDMMDAGIGLMMMGHNGTGKTSIACSIAKRARMTGATVIFTSAASLMETLLDRGGDRDMIGKVRDYDLLVLDDLGKEHSGQSSWSENTLESLFRHRNGEKLTTVVTTNLSTRDGEKDSNGRVVRSPSLVERYKLSLLETMREMCYPIEVEGRNMRDDSAAMIRKIFEQEEE